MLSYTCTLPVNSIRKELPKIALQTICVQCECVFTPALLFQIIFLLRVTREKLVAAIWKVKPILKWEIDSIQAVIDEEKENRQGTFYKMTSRILQGWEFSTS